MRQFSIQGCSGGIGLFFSYERNDYLFFARGINLPSLKEPFSMISSLLEEACLTASNFCLSFSESEEDLSLLDFFLGLPISSSYFSSSYEDFLFLEKRTS